MKKNKNYNHPWNIIIIINSIHDQETKQTLASQSIKNYSQIKAREKMVQMERKEGKMWIKQIFYILVIKYDIRQIDCKHAGIEN